MRGLIGKKDVLFHPIVVVQGFGWKVYVRALLASPKRTFLEVISEGIPHPATPKEIECTLELDKMISFELRSAFIYARLADLFHENRQARDFFRTLSSQEDGHAEILRITKVEVARRNLWTSVVPVKPEIMDRTDKMLAEVEWALRSPERLPLGKALQYVEELESSEINVVFEFVVHSVKSPFLKNIYRLVPSVADHQTFLNNMLPVLKEEVMHEQHHLRRHNPSA